MLSTGFFFDVCAFIIASVLLCSAFFKKTLSGRTNRLFVLELVVMLTAVLARIIFQLISAKLDYSPLALSAAYFFCYMFMVVERFIVPVATLFMFSSIGIWQILFKRTAARLCFLIACALPVAFILYDVPFKRIFFISGAMRYYESNAVIVLYLFSLAFFALGIFFLCKYRKIVPRIKKTLSIIIYAFNLAFALIQCLFPEIQVEMFVVSVSAYLILLFTQRPELLFDPAVNAKNAASFEEDCKRVFTLRLSRSMILLRLLNTKNISLCIGQENYSKFLRYFSAILRSVVSCHKGEFDIYYYDRSLFAVCAESAGKDDMEILAESINGTMQKTMEYMGFELFPEISVCVLSIPQDIENWEYFEYFSRNFHKIIGKTSRPALVRDFAGTTDFKIKNGIDRILRDAFQYEKFEVFFMPIWEKREKRFVAAEALVRLKDSVYGYIEPSLFLPAAENNGLVHEIGNIVFEKVCRFVSSDEFKTLGLRYIEVRLSKAQCAQIDLVDRVIDCLNVYGVSPGQIRFEITENSGDFNPALAEQNINSLYKIGIAFALNDYGTGYSSIKRVTSFPLRAVKLDKSFIAGIETPGMLSVIRNTVQMMKHLDMEVCVEGVDDESAALLVESLGCDLEQGLFYSQPLPEKQFSDFILNKHFR